MTSDIYHRLRERLDEYSHGFATTESGIEIKILERVFTKEEAEMYLHLSDKLQTAQDIAARTGQDPDEVENLLQRMTEKGHTFPRFPKKESEPFYYAAAPWSHGIWEHIARRLDKETASMIHEHFKLGAFTRGPNPVRNIPIHSAIQDKRTIAPFDDVKSIISSKKVISITDCACYDTRRIIGDHCEQPKAVCMMFDFYADYYIAQGKGRRITTDEAHAMLEKVEEAGLVHQMSNSESPDAICNCCPDCCQGLLFLRRIRRPAEVAVTNYFAQVDAELCGGCETCVDRCPMDAISMVEDGISSINLERCIGCGLCVSTCPEEALTLQQKRDEEHRTPPVSAAVMRPSREIEESMPPNA